MNKKNKMGFSAIMGETNRQDVKQSMKQGMAQVLTPGQTQQNIRAGLASVFSEIKEARAKK